MSTEQINIRLDTDIVAALERVAREESSDRATTIRRLLEASLRQWQVDHAVRAYQRGDLSLGRAAEEAGLTQWELQDVIGRLGIAHPLGGLEARRRLAQLTARDAPTLPDIPPAEGGVLLVGINPAPVSVSAGHYYQGRLGRRLWRRLESIGLLHDATPGAEDEAFARAGNGLTDLAKRPTASAAELTADELRDGVDALHAKVVEWRPGLVLFAFKGAAETVFGARVKAGSGPQLDHVATFLLSGPYAAASERERNDAELRELLRTRRPTHDHVTERTQRVTAKDIAAGRIRLPRETKRFFPSTRTEVDVVLRGTRLRCPYDPRTGPDRERSAVLSVGRDILARLVQPNEVLRVARSAAGIPVID